MYARLSSEKIAYWFFRLSGCLTIENFIIHPDFVDQPDVVQRTDADLLAVRFPYRQEPYHHDDPMEDHELFLVKKTQLYIVEIKKSGHCRFNGPWTKPERENMERVLSAIGFLPRDLIPEASKQLYETYEFKSEKYRIRLIAIAKKRSDILPEKIQFTYSGDILPFIYRRFDKYIRVKSSHPQWGRTGDTLYRMVKRCESSELFTQKILDKME